MTASAIEWTDATWNPTRGCSIVSPGCVNCYAMKQAHRFSGPGRAYAGMTKLTKAGPQWTGVVRVAEDKLLEPLGWRKPRRVFVDSMSDLFHEDVPDDFIDRVFAVMGLSPWHTYQVLTKRVERMRDYMLERWQPAPARRDVIGGKVYNRPAETVGDDRHAVVLAAASDILHGSIGDQDRFWTKEESSIATAQPWPLPNVWLGVSVENQEQLKRIDSLKDTPAAVHFVSFEPLLEDLGALILDGVEWAIVGGESGPGARPCRVAWIRSIVQQCRAGDVSVFVKQLGAKPEGDPRPPDRVNPTTGARTLTVMQSIEIHNRKGGDPAEWPEDLRVRQYPEARA